MHCTLSWRIYANGFRMRPTSVAIPKLSCATLWNACSALRTWLLASESGRDLASILCWVITRSFQRTSEILRNIIETLCNYGSNACFLCNSDGSSGNISLFHATTWLQSWRTLDCHVASWEPDNIVKDLLLSLLWPHTSGKLSDPGSLVSKEVDLLIFIH